MSKALQEKINELFEATKDLKSLDEIKPHCEQFNEWVNTHTTYSSKSLGTVLSRCGFYKMFKSIPLEQGKNADAIAKHDENGNVKGHELKHYVTLLCGLDKEQWAKRNHTSQGIDRAENPTEVEPAPYLEVVGKLLANQDANELGVGIVAASGRRPHEVIARAKFSPVEGKPYHVMFEGQGKKRGKEPVFEIATLYPAEFVIKCLANLRKTERVASLLKEVRAEFPGDIAAQNRAIDSRFNGSLNRVVREYFGDKGDKTPVLPFRHGQEQDNCTALRAAYAVLATERDCKGSMATKMLYASQLLGHFVKGENPNDDELRAFVRTAKYSDYFVSKPVPFPELPKKEKASPVRAAQSDAEVLKGLQLSWKLPNQQAVISRLIERQEKNVELGRQLQEMSHKLSEAKAKLREAEVKINQLEKEQQEMLQVELTSEVEAAIRKVVAEELQQALANLPQLQPSDAKPMATTTASAIAKQPEVIDWESKTNTEVWSTRIQGAASEKMRRAFNAICLYNDTIATGDNDRLAVTNQGLRDLTGVNGQQISEWLREHEDEIVTHHMKYGMQPLDPTGNPANKDGQVRLDSYYNKRYGKEGVRVILSAINSKLLDGVAKL